jgi:hypothetical protein
MARRKPTKRSTKATTDLVPRLRAAVKLVDEALGKLERPPAQPRRPGRKLDRR